MTITRDTAAPHEYPFFYNESGGYCGLPSMGDIQRVLASITDRFEQEERAIMRMRTALSQMPKSCPREDEQKMRALIDNMERAHDDNVETFQVRMRLVMGIYVRGER